MNIDIEPHSRPAPAKASATLGVHEIASQAEWSAHFSKLPFAALTQCWAYGEAKRVTDGWSVSRLLIERSGTPIALCQVLKKRLLGIPAAARISRGPLFFEAVPSGNDVSETLRLVRRYCCFPRGGVLLLAPGIKADGGAEELLSASRYYRRGNYGWMSALVDLRPDAPELRKGFGHGWRNRLKHALKSPLVPDIAAGTQALDWMIARHEENMRQKQFSAQNGTFLRALTAAAPGDFIVARAMLDGEAVAGMLLLRFGRFAEYFVGWFGVEGRKHNAGNFLYWHAMIEMKRRGCEWLDVGGHSYEHQGYDQFKAGLKGQVYKLAGEWMTL